MKFKLSVKKINSGGIADKSSEILLPEDMIKDVSVAFDYPEEKFNYSEDLNDGMEIVLNIKGDLYFAADRGQSAAIYRWAGLCLAKKHQKLSDDKSLGGIFRDVELWVRLNTAKENEGFRKIHLPWATVVKYEEIYDEEAGEGGFILIVKQEVHALSKFKSDKTRAIEIDGMSVMNEAKKETITDKMSGNKDKSAAPVAGSTDQGAAPAAGAGNKSAAPTAGETKTDKGAAAPIAKVAMAAAAPAIVAAALNKSAAPTPKQAGGNATAAPTPGQASNNAAAAPTPGQASNNAAAAPTPGQTSNNAAAAPTPGQTSNNATAAPTPGQASNNAAVAPTPGQTSNNVAAAPT
ncbi:MAG: hypothetical protein IKN12_00475, partial [Selenomonadaceae bacterium]|nr:hypothetical protein [Selenomonadaceae bacterium]